MLTQYEAKAGTVNLEGTTTFSNEDFGYTLFEDVIDPANPEGPRAIGMHLPAHSMSKVWQLVENGYSERIELLSGSASLVIGRAGNDEWITAPLIAENPTGDDIEVTAGDVFCVVTDDEEAFVLSRPSKPFDISYEQGLTKTPQDELSRFVLAHAAAQE